MDARRELHAVIKQQQARMGGMKAAEEPGFYASTVVRAVRTCIMSTVIEKRKKPPQGISTPRARTWLTPHTAAAPAADQPAAMNNRDIKVSDGGKEGWADDTGKARAAPCCASVIIATAV